MKTTLQTTTDLAEQLDNNPRNFKLKDQITASTYGDPKKYPMLLDLVEELNTLSEEAGNGNMQRSVSRSISKWNRLTKKFMILRQTINKPTAALLERTYWERKLIELNSLKISDSMKKNLGSYMKARLRSCSNGTVVINFLYA